MIYIWKCSACDIHIEIQRPIAECTIPPDSEERCNCPGPQWVRVYTAPALMSVALPDGTKRKGFAELKEAAKLQVEAAGSKMDRKKEIAQEIRKLGVKPSKGIL